MEPFVSCLTNVNAVDTRDHLLAGVVRAPFLNHSLIHTYQSSYISTASDAMHAEQNDAAQRRLRGWKEPATGGVS